MNLRLIALIATTFTGVLTFADSVSAKNVAVCDIQRTTEQQLAQDASSPDRGLRPEPIQKAPAKKVIPSNVPPRPTNNADDFETVLWNIVKASQDPADYESYLEIYPRGRFAKEARERLKRIKADTRAAPAPRTPPTQKRNAAGPEPVLVELNL